MNKMLLSLFLSLLLAAVLVAPALAQADEPGGPDMRSNTPYAVGWGALMLINAGLAQGKNRRGLNWFLISLPLGPLATLLLVAFFPKLPDHAASA